MDDILLALLEKEKMNYQQVVDLGIRRQNARDRLDELIQLGLVREEGRESWKRGKKLWYSLTEKGREESMRLAVNNIDESLKIVQKISAKIQSNPSMIEAWRKAARKAALDFKTSEDIPFEEDLKKLKEYTDKWYGPLRMSLRTLHEIFLKISLPSAQLKNGLEYEYFIRPGKREIHIMHEKVLEHMKDQLAELRSKVKKTKGE